MAGGLLTRRDDVLLVASRYPNQPSALWNLPGGRQRDGELLADTVRREFDEETGLQVVVAGLRYVSESYDRTTATHFLSTIFEVEAAGEPSVPHSDAHVVDVAWIGRPDLAGCLTVRVVREPLLANLADERRRYFAFAEAGVTIEFADEA